MWRLGRIIYRAECFECKIYEAELMFNLKKILNT